MARNPQKWKPVLRKNARDFDVRNLNEAIGLGISIFKTWSGLSSNDGRGSNLLPARSDGLDNVDGGPDAAFYIQLGVIEQVSICGRFQRRHRPVLVAFVTFEDIRQHGGLVDVLPPRPRLQGPAAGTHSCVGYDEDFDVGVGTDHGSDVAAIQHRARRIGGKLPLKVQ